ncbi:TPA: acyl-CoA thioesterase [Candidatus Woesearchaeota archaeon]|nr:MAG: thioesterase, acyl-CoA thioester hydrolase [archaeon GW2011_AR11]HIH05376.1 acyl-CoA thioesterase [Candidatus Woesearchaeota archaeon]HIH91401.1 acyl-CoA thioesterase [Candidatus Woesearchaeota archaeon]HII64438.1 acyl-CoA thioesterase [Candidatus Woesearchaeota archaeon]HIJ19206.1 acyl-CoA thioesterase [Candidatus Woesearchaeota archaeon]
MFSSTTEQRVYYADTDHGGVAYYASYLRRFEVGRTELLRELGIEQGELDREGILLPVVEVKCEYKSPALYNDIILIETSIMKIGNKSITFSYGILRKEGRKLLAQGHTVNVFAKGTSSTEIPPDIRKKLEKS